MILPRKKALIAVAIGIVLGGLPVLGFNYWLGVLIQQQSVDDVVYGANRAVGIVEGRLTPVVASIDDLVRQGITSCGPRQVETLRRARFVSSSIKAFLIIGPDGKTQCSNGGGEFGERSMVSSDRLAEPENVVLEVVRFSELPTLFIWLRRDLANGSSLAAMVPVELLLPLTAGQGGPFSAWAQISARDGTVIAEGGTPVPPETPADDVLKAKAQSARFGVTVSTQMSRQHNVQRFNGLWAVATVVNAAIAIGVLMTGWLLLRKSASHPLADVERALGAKEFIAYYQPIVDITNAKLLGAEVLVRGRKNDGTIVAPAAFVPLLEQGGLIMEMTRQLMRRVSVEVGPAFALRPHLKVSFNLTAAHFADDKVVEDVRAIFSGSQVRLSQVTLELTERQPLENLTTTRRVIAALQGLGCSIALDDVGTGHSGLSSILRLGVDVIKIDKMFVDSISDEHHSATIIETLVDLARNMRMDVVAEGVENFEQVTHLRERGIRAAQGYIFAPPLPASAFLGLLEAIDPLEEEDSVEQRLRQFAMA